MMGCAYQIQVYQIQRICPEKNIKNDKKQVLVRSINIKMTRLL